MLTVRLIFAHFPAHDSSIACTRDWSLLLCCVSRRPRNPLFEERERESSCFSIAALLSAASLSTVLLPRLSLSHPLLSFARVLAVERKGYMSWRKGDWERVCLCACNRVPLRVCSAGNERQDSQRKGWQADPCVRIKSASRLQSRVTARDSFARQIRETDG